MKYKLFSINDSFAHVKRELAASNEQHEVMAFIWSTFHKIIGSNDNDNAKARSTAVSEKSRSDTSNVQLAAIEDDQI